MRRLLGVATALALGFGAASTASAIQIGTSVGDLIVHYNTASPETPSNISYIQSGNNVFNFNQNLTVGAPGYGANHFFQAIVDQFRFDIQLVAPTDVPPAPGDIVAHDGNTIGGTGTTNVDWAVTDPGFPNSPLQGGNGSGGSILFSQVLTPIAGGFKMFLSGELTTDNLIHWATAAGSNLNGTSTISPSGWDALFPNGKMYFSGELTYLTANDTTSGQDVYTGTINFESALPLPTAVPMGLLLFTGIAAGVRRRRSMFAAC